MQIPDHYQIKYASTFKSRIQQTQNRLANYVTFKPDATGKVCFIDQIEPIDLDQKTSRHEKSQMTEVETARRALTYKTFAKMVGFDEDDGFKLNQQSVPMPQAATELMNGFKRAAELSIINGVGGVNQIGVEGDDDMLTTEAFPAGNIIPVTEGVATGNSNLPVNKVLAGVEMLMGHEAFEQSSDEDLGMPTLVISSNQLIDLFRQTKVNNADHTGGAATVVNMKARLESYLGCQIIVTNQLVKNGNIREALLFYKQAATFGIPQNYSAKLGENFESGGARLRVKATVGACRTDREKGFAKLLCDESIKTAA